MTPAEQLQAMGHARVLVVLKPSKKEEAGRADGACA